MRRRSQRFTAFVKNFSEIMPLKETRPSKQRSSRIPQGCSSISLTTFGVISWQMHLPYSPRSRISTTSRLNITRSCSSACRGIRALWSCQRPINHWKNRRMSRLRLTTPSSTPGPRRAVGFQRCSNHTNPSAKIRTPDFRPPGWPSYVSVSIEPSAAASHQRRYSTPSIRSLQNASTARGSRPRPPRKIRSRTTRSFRCAAHLPPQDRLGSPPFDRHGSTTRR